MGCAKVTSRFTIGSPSKHFNIEMAEMGAEARGVTIAKLYRKFPGLQEARNHHEEVDFTTQLEVSEWLEFPLPFFYRHTIPDRRGVIMCGPGLVPCEFCGEAADFRCDFPIGKGRTCDLPLCTEHKTHLPDVGTGIDYCPHHQAQSKHASPTIH